MSECNQCHRRVLSHSHILCCSLCRAKTHKLCIPHITSHEEFLDIKKSDWICLKCIENVFPFSNLENGDQLESALSERDHLDFRLKDLEHMIFNPLSHDLEVNDPLSDIDPDENFLNEYRSNLTTNSKYLTEATFKLKTKAIPNCSISMMHQNIRSIPKNLDRFDHLIDDLEWKFDILGFSETWLKNLNADLYSIANYNHIYLTRKSKSGGGVSMFIRDHIKYTKREDLSIMTTSAEC